MVGANYMGGKRNIARTKSKDVVGRAQRRHFVKQRLASALCTTQENRVHTSTPTLSFPPEITLAHARRDADQPGATSSTVFTNGDQLYLSRSPSNTMQRNRPSKVLGALDTLDRIQDTSMRAAIDRILNQPTLVGINTSMRLIRARLASKDPDILDSQTLSKHTFDSLAYPETPRHEHKETLKEPKRYWSTDGLALPDSPSRMHAMIFWNTVNDSGYAEAQLFGGVSPFRTEGDEPDRIDTFPDSIYPLPRSSPFPSSSQLSDSSILDLDTSPLASIRFGRPDDLSEEDNGSMEPTKPFSVPRSFFRHLTHDTSIRGSTGVDETQSTHSSFTNSDERELETSCDSFASPSTRNNAFGDSLPFGQDTIHVLASTEDFIEEEAPSKISIDFLADPHPWETIGRILKLEPLGSSTTQFMPVSFTKGREGVGYVPLERSDTGDTRSDTLRYETRTDDRSMDDTHVVFNADPPIPDTVDLDLEVPSTDDHMAVDARPCANSSRSLFDAGSPSTPGEVDPCTHVHVLHEAPLIPVIPCTQNDHTRSPSPVTLIVEITTGEPDDDTNFAGPCLFGDSDLEDE